MVGFELIAQLIFFLLEFFFERTNELVLKPAAFFFILRES
jgi:hypothetical protein